MAYRLNLKLSMLHLALSLLVGLVLFIDFTQFGSISISNLSLMVVSPGLLSGIQLYFNYKTKKSIICNLFDACIHYLFYIIPLLIFIVSSGINIRDVLSCIVISIFCFLLAFQFYIVKNILKNIYIRILMVFITISGFVSPLFGIFTYLEAALITPVIAYATSLLLISFVNRQKKIRY
ncbi:hypothetical protein [Paenibacillus sp. 8b26]|uniref:hypothetical protein n=1 Tax=Paenibacillus sp. 8b26 TaxID=3424133 RepID=UPI003D64A49B